MKSQHGTAPSRSSSACSKHIAQSDVCVRASARGPAPPKPRVTWQPGARASPEGGDSSGRIDGDLT